MGAEEKIVRVGFGIIDPGDQSRPNSKTERHTEFLLRPYIGFNIGYRSSWQTAIGGVPPALIDDNLKKWSGSHLFDPALIPGIVFSNQNITKENPSIYDIAPTILKLAGFSKERLKKDNFDGGPLF